MNGSRAAPDSVQSDYGGILSGREEEGNGREEERKKDLQKPLSSSLLPKRVKDTQRAMMKPHEITSRQADAIVELIASLRPDWDKRGITAALRAATTGGLSRCPSRLAVAAVFAATNASNVTPAVIGMRGKHWDAVDPNRATEPPSHGGRCPDCHAYHKPGAPHDHHKPAADPTGHARTIRGLMQKTTRYDKVSTAESAT